LPCKHVDRQRPAITALAATHGKSGGTLDAPDRRAGQHEFLESARLYLFAATDDGFSRRTIGKLGDRLEQLPQRLLKSALPPETGARRHGVVQGGCRGVGADIDGGSQSGDDAFRLGGAGTAEAGCVTDGEDGVDACPAILVVGRSQATGGRIIVVATSKQPCRKP
jgi:hypothetical protein